MHFQGRAPAYMPPMGAGSVDKAKPAMENAKARGASSYRLKHLRRENFKGQAASTEYIAGEC